MEGEAVTLAESKQTGRNIHLCAGQLYSLINLWTVPKSEVFDLTSSAVELTSPPFQTPLNLNVMLSRGSNQVACPSGNLAWQINKMRTGQPKDNLKWKTTLRREGDFFSLSVGMSMHKNYRFLPPSDNNRSYYT